MFIREQKEKMQLLSQKEKSELQKGYKRETYKMDTIVVINLSNTTENCQTVSWKLYCTDHTRSMQN